MADGMITRDEEERLRAFRDRLALENSAADQGAMSELDRAGADRVVMEARLAAISVRDGDGHLQDLALSIRQAGLGQGEANRLLIRAWETAVQGALEDGLLSLDEENALARSKGERRSPLLSVFRHQRSTPGPSPTPPAGRGTPRKASV